jgi:hypothetical protein
LPTNNIYFANLPLRVICRLAETLRQHYSKGSIFKSSPSFDSSPRISVAETR